MKQEIKNSQVGDLPSNEIIAIGSYSIKLILGLIKMTAPKKVIKVANHLCKWIFSFKKGIANNIAKIGLVKFIAIASETGIRLEAPNKILTPTQPEIVLDICNFIFGFFNVDFVVQNMIAINIKANKNLEWLIWSGFNPIPNLLDPNILAIIVVAAIKADANTIKIIGVKLGLFSRKVIFFDYILSLLLASNAATL